jgi:hypothetical protein
MGRIPRGPPGRTEDAGWRDFVVGLRLAAKRTKGGPHGMEKLCRRPSTCSEEDKGWATPVILPQSVQRVDEGLQRRVASSPSPQHLPSEGPVRLSHLVPKTSLDGGDAALARSGSAGVFDVTIDGRGTVGLRASRSVAPCVKRGVERLRLCYLFVRCKTLAF